MKWEVHLQAVQDSHSKGATISSITAGHRVGLRPISSKTKGHSTNSTGDLMAAAEIPQWAAGIIRTTAASALAAPAADTETTTHNT